MRYSIFNIIAATLSLATFTVPAQASNTFVPKDHGRPFDESISTWQVTTDIVATGEKVWSIVIKTDDGKIGRLDLIRIPWEDEYPRIVSQRPCEDDTLTWWRVEVGNPKNNLGFDCNAQIIDGPIFDNMAEYIATLPPEALAAIKAATE